MIDRTRAPQTRAELMAWFCDALARGIGPLGPLSDEPVPFAAVRGGGAAQIDALINMCRERLNAIQRDIAGGRRAASRKNLLALFEVCELWELLESRCRGERPH